MRHEYTFDKEFNGIKFNLQYSWNSGNPALIWEVPSEKYINLWYNEMQGQISDGMWENSWGTNWLWQNPVFFVLGKECKLYTRYIWPQRKSYSIRGFLKYNWFQERLPEEAGVATFAEAKAIWNEMNEAIKNVENYQESPYAAWMDVYAKNQADKKERVLETAIEELRKNPRVEVNMYSTPAKHYIVEYKVKDMIEPGSYPSVYSINIVEKLLAEAGDSDIRNAKILGIGKDGFCTINDLDRVMELKVELNRILNFKN